MPDDQFALAVSDIGVSRRIIRGDRINDGDDATTNAERRDRRLDGDACSVANLAADKPQNALANRGDHPAGARILIVNIFINHDIAIAADAERRSIRKQNLRRAGWRGLDALLVNNMGTNRQHPRGVARRRARRILIDRADATDILRRDWCDADEY